MSKLPLETSSIVRVNRYILSEYIRDERIRTSTQLTAAINYLKKTNTFDIKTFEDICGIGIIIDKKEIINGVTKLLNDNADLLTKQRYNCLSTLLNQLNTSNLKWGDGKMMKAEFDKQISTKLGPKTEADKVMNKINRSRATHNKVVTVDEQKKVNGNVSTDGEERDDYEEKSRAIPAARNTEQQLKRHLDITG